MCRDGSCPRSVPSVHYKLRRGWLHGYVDAQQERDGRWRYAVWRTFWDPAIVAFGFAPSQEKVRWRAQRLFSKKRFRVFLLQPRTSLSLFVNSADAAAIALAGGSCL